MGEIDAIRYLLAELIDVVEDLAMEMEADGRDLTNARSRLQQLKDAVFVEGKP